MPSAKLLVLAVLLSTPAAAATPADTWLAGLTDRVVDDLAAGKPLVVQVHVPLCEGTIIACGNKKLGDGESPADNLYWATDEGFVGWFDRRRSGWKEVLHGDGTTVGEKDVLDVRVWTRTVSTPDAWHKRGVAKTYPVYVVAFAWRGKAIDHALAVYLDELYGTGGHRDITLADGTTHLDAGGGAQIVGYTGHNRLYDVDAPDWAKLERDGAPTRGTIDIACNTGPFMADHIAAAKRVPLIFTNDFLMASAGAFEGAVNAFASGGGYRDVRGGAARGYATAGGHDLARIGGVFTNPADPRWGHWQL
jgi:hypothetical protein